MQIILRVLAGPYKGRVFSFDQADTFLIGRTNDSHLSLPEDRFFSRHHCLLERNPPHSLLRDLDSTNGTFVNGRRVREASLQNGDQIQGGETVLLVDVQPDQPAGPVQPAPSTGPKVVRVACLNCGRSEQAQASATDD